MCSQALAIEIVESVGILVCPAAVGAGHSALGEDRAVQIQVACHVAR